MQALAVGAAGHAAAHDNCLQNRCKLAPTTARPATAAAHKTQNRADYLKPIATMLSSPVPNMSHPTSQKPYPVKTPPQNRPGKPKHCRFRDVQARSNQEDAVSNRCESDNDPRSCQPRSSSSMYKQRHMCCADTRALLAAQA